jgi:hypothetical protein
LTAVEWTQVFLAVAIPLSILGVIVHRLVSKKGVGVRVIQFVGASSLVPGVVILALADKLDSTNAAIFGAFAGYLFSNIASFDHRD